MRWIGAVAEQSHRCFTSMSLVRQLLRPFRLHFRHSLLFFSTCLVLLPTRASDYPSDQDGAYLQMRLSYSPAAHFFLFLVQWTDCHLAGALGLLKFFIYK